MGINSSFLKGDFEKTNSAKSNILLMLSISGMCKNIEIPTIYAPKRCPICSPCLNAVLSGLHTRPLGSVGRVKLGGRTRTFQAHRLGLDLAARTWLVLAHPLRAINLGQRAVDLA